MYVNVYVPQSGGSVVLKSDVYKCDPLGLGSRQNNSTGQNSEQNELEWSNPFHVKTVVQRTWRGHQPPLPTVGTIVLDRHSKLGAE